MTIFDNKKGLNPKIILLLSIMNLLVIVIVLFISFQLQQAEKWLQNSSNKTRETLTVLSLLQKNMKLFSLEMLEIREAARVISTNIKQAKGFDTKLVKSQQDDPQKRIEILTALMDLHNQGFEKLKILEKRVKNGQKTQAQNSNHVQVIEKQISAFANISRLEKTMNFLKQQILFTLTIILFLSFVTSFIIFRLIKQSQIAVKQASEARHRAEIQSWIKSKLAGLYDKTRGELDLVTLGQKIISYLTPTIKAQMGALYYNDNGILKLMATYAYPIDVLEFKIGQGVPGQAAKEQKTILLSNVPDEAIKIYTTVGGIKPRHILAIPIIFDRHVKGVIELSLFKQLSKIQTEFLQHAADSIAISFNSAEYRSQMQRLLEKSVNQSEELLTQQKELEQQREWFEVTLSSIGDAIITTDVTARITFMNPIAESLTGWNSQQAQKQNITEIFHIINEQTRQSLENPVETVIREGGMSHFTNHTLLIARNGCETPIDNSGAPIKSKNDELLGVVLIFRDIIERRKVEQAIIRAKEEAEMANRAKSTFLANMSHELRTPLNGILGYTQILSRDKTLNAQQQKGIHVIHRSGEYLLTLINDVLDLSKIEAGKMELCPTDFHFGQFINDITTLFQMRVQQKGITFIYKALSSLPTGIYADEKRLRQVLINLLGNAVKFTQQGEVRLKMAYHEPKMLFQVEDTGPGIAQEDLEKIFLPFQQVGEQYQQVDGTGLGLPITKKLVEMMGGKLQVKSTFGKGSTFWIELNLPVVSKLAQLEPVYQAPIIGLSGPPRKILVVDDKETNRAILVNMLLPLGFEVIEAVNGQDGFEKAVIFLPDAILMDLGMPVMDGLEATRQIRQTRILKDIVIIAASANVFEQDHHNSLTTGCNDFIGKPIQTELLLEKLQTHLQLEWVYEETDSSKVQPEKHLQALTNQALAIPATETVKKLYELSEMGDIGGILEAIGRIEQADSQFAPFTAQLRQLTEEFQLQEISELLEPYLNSA